MIFLVVSLIGTASPRPTPATAVLIPTTWPCPSASAPPELPGLRAASVWITFSTIRPAARERTGSERPSADTTPAVTEPAKPCGFPIATTSWPTRRFSASPSTAGVKSVSFGAQHGEVRERVRPDDLDADLAAVHEGGADTRGAARNHVRGGEHEAVGRDDNAASAPVHTPAAANPPRDAEIGDGGRKALRDGDDGPGVRVEDVLLLVGSSRGDKRKIHHRSKLAAAGRSTEWPRSRRSATEA